MMDWNEMLAKRKGEREVEEEVEEEETLFQDSLRNSEPKKKQVKG